MSASNRTLCVLDDGLSVRRECTLIGACLPTDFTTNQHHWKLWSPTSRFDWFYYLSTTPSGNNFLRHHFFWASSNRSPFHLLLGYFLRLLHLVEIRASKRLSILCSQPYQGNVYPTIMLFFNKSQESIKVEWYWMSCVIWIGSEDYAEDVTIDRWP